MAQVGESDIESLQEERIARIAEALQYPRESEVARGHRCLGWRGRMRLGAR